MNKIIKYLAVIIFLFIILFKLINIQDILLKKFYPLKFEEYVNKYSQEYEIDPLLIYAIIKTESNFNEKSVSVSGAVGLMQLMDSTAKEMAENAQMEYIITDLYNPEINIKLGTNYFYELQDYYKSTNLAIAAYNAGIGNVAKWIESGIIEKDGSNIEEVPFKETNNYVRKVLRNYNIYKELYKKDGK